MRNYRWHIARNVFCRCFDVQSTHIEKKKTKDSAVEKTSLHWPLSSLQCAIFYRLLVRMNSSHILRTCFIPFWHKQTLPKLHVIAMIGVCGRHFRHEIVLQLSFCCPLQTLLGLKGKKISLPIFSNAPAKCHF